MGIKELNLCELLKGHEGEQFYSLSLGEVTLKRIENDVELCFINEKDESIDVNPDGTSRYGIGGVCLIFPSRDLYEKYPLDAYAAWMEWKEKPHWLCVGVWFGETGHEGEEDFIDLANIRFRTPAERDKYIDEIRAIIEKYKNQ